MSETMNHASDIWESDGSLKPLVPKPLSSDPADVAVIIVNRNRPDLTDALVDQVRQMGRELTVDIFVVEMGSDKTLRSRYCSIYYNDPDFRGKCYGHNVGLRLARARGNYRYFWFLMNDLVFDPDQDALGAMVSIADLHPDFAILSPTELTGVHPASTPRPDREFHVVSSCDYLSLLIPNDVINQIGFLNPSFKYSWGAIHELSYKIYQRNKKIVYCDTVTMKHLGGTTYGKVKGSVSREEYQFRAREFAARYFVEHYGKNWDTDFARVLPPVAEYPTLYIKTRASWEKVLTKQERELYHVKRSNPVKRYLHSLFRLFSPSTSNSRLLEEINQLNPWYYPVKIETIEVTPGIGSRESTADLIERTQYFHQILVEEVIKHYSFSGKKLLDIASNCGYWSARYVEQGAVSMTAVEGRWTAIQQGKLYWGHNNFLRPEQYEFIHGNVMEKHVWEHLEKRAPFDFTLCAGILYHIPNYLELLRKIDSVTIEAILIDTRISEQEMLIEEPGGWSFDAIVETRKKHVPEYGKIESFLHSRGYGIIPLTNPNPIPKGLGGADDFSKGNRIAILALKNAYGKSDAI